VLGVATTRELAFVAMLLLVVLIAPKVPRIGEAIGRRLGKQPPGENPGSRGGSPDT
jgi:hypothetical protein